MSTILVTLCGCFAGVFSTDLFPEVTFLTEVFTDSTFSSISFDSSDS